LKFESYTLQSKNRAHNGFDSYAQNALKLAYEHLLFQKFSQGHTRGIPPDSSERVREGKGRKKRKAERKEGRGRIASWLFGEGGPSDLLYQKTAKPVLDAYSLLFLSMLKAQLLIESFGTV